MDLIHAGSGQYQDWLVVAWFTPDYRPLAERLSASLRAHDVPHHLYACPPFGASFAERTRHKPEIVVRAMDDYPDRTLVLMDVDCVVTGDPYPLVDEVTADVGFTMKPRPATPPRISLAASSRVMVFRPTLEARAFAEAWRHQCNHPLNAGLDDETCLAWTFVLCPGARCQHLSTAYSGREFGTTGKVEPIIGHVSENAKRDARPWSLRRTMKGIEKRFFRRGRTTNWRAARLS